MFEEVTKSTRHPYNVYNIYPGRQLFLFLVGHISPYTLRRADMLHIVKFGASGGYSHCMKMPFQSILCTPGA